MARQGYARLIATNRSIPGLQREYEKCFYSGSSTHFIVPLLWFQIERHVPRPHFIDKRRLQMNPESVIMSGLLIDSWALWTNMFFFSKFSIRSSLSLCLDCGCPSTSEFLPL